MNSTIETILNHKSIRKFQERSLTKEQIETIVKSAQAASTSSFIQAYSIIGVKDQQKKEKLAELAGNQAYVAQNGHFFVFCADLHRHELIGEMEEKDFSGALESTEKFMVSLIDAALVAQNASIAAESMGLGIVYIGGIRNNLEEVCQLLNVPKKVIPLFGLAVGYPDQSPDVKPRLPLAHIYHEDSYNENNSVLKDQLKDYNELISSYYEKRTSGKRKDTWTEQMAQMLSNPKRQYMKDFIEGKGFSRR
ncbi:oxygen-insensitive NADPH nitroreductase [Alkalihalobacterium chitinilyticum]|uniref:Oxygen-insensitive NADPH nitroreductase n=1 Tax=Alkalihalobacterium chitinilyticum TaxID=2980103 RepID=A0ABT5VG25_9BACI|nr:oxygen-insensitive NADPH nitroreductase [Alkalihalobacterium chitinilyticum]MDE5414408.1 oxygen-insensitive NADPH nitroreductase [Alkalihalobacterium chitinilyticum]